MTNETHDVDPLTDVIARDIVDAAIRVHRELGPGLLESAYRRCLAHELRTRGHRVEVEIAIPIEYGNVLIETAFRADLVVDETVIVELKAVEKLTKVHFAQLLTYLKLTKSELGFLINFNEARIVDGLHRVVRTSRSPTVAAV